MRQNTFAAKLKGHATEVYLDGIYMMGGNAIIADNIFSATGYDGAEAVNIKSGCKVDVARNIMFSPNTNGLKLSSSDQSEVRHQALIQAYNNTIINSGWRRDGEKGGCIYVEEMANVSVFNNLLVNCKFRAITPAYDEPGSEDCYDSENSMIDYNFYASGNVQSHLYFEGAYEDDGETLYYSGVKFPYEGYAYDHEEYDPSADTHSKIAKSSSEADELDPDFVGYSLDADPADYTWNDSWDFHVNAGSPVLEGYYTPSGDRMPFYATSGLTVNGQEYKSRIKLKSGSMTGVKCFSGYVIPADGDLSGAAVFSIMINNSTLSQYRMQKIADRLMYLIAVSVE